MKLTPLLAAAALVLVATAPSASALCLLGRGCVDGRLVTDTTEEVSRTATDAADQATGLAFFVLGVALGAANEQTEDRDGDNVPDVAEPIICGNDLVVLVVNGEAVDGECPTRTNYVPPDNLGLLLGEVDELSGLVLGEAEEARAELERQVREVQAEGNETVAFVGERVGEAVVFAEGQLDEILLIVDPDGDNVPDAVEPILCLVENQGIEQDGECTADNQDYTPWSP